MWTVEKQTFFNFGSAKINNKVIVLCDGEAVDLTGFYLVVSCSQLRIKNATFR